MLELWINHSMAYPQVKVNDLLQNIVTCNLSQAKIPRFL